MQILHICHTALPLGFTFRRSNTYRIEIGDMNEILPPPSNIAVKSSSYFRPVSSRTIHSVALGLTGLLIATFFLILVASTCLMWSARASLRFPVMIFVGEIHRVTCWRVFPPRRILNPSQPWSLFMYQKDPQIGRASCRERV